MTDAELVAKKLAEIETRIEELERLGRPKLLATDLKEQRFILMTLQLAIQGALDVASHIVSSEKLGEPERNRDLFGLLATGDWLKEDLAGRLQQMAGFRNVLVHDYMHTDLRVVRDVLENRLDDLLSFCTVVRRRLPG